MREFIREYLPRTRTVLGIMNEDIGPKLRLQLKGAEQAVIRGSVECDA